MKKPTKKKTLREYKFEDDFKSYKREWIKKYKQEKREEYLAASTLDQRKLLIAALRDGLPFTEAMDHAGITDKTVAQNIYFRNLKKVTHYVLREVDKVK